MSPKLVRTSGPGFTANAPPDSNTRWFVCGLLFLATTINYMDRSVLSLIEPALHDLPFMGWNHAAGSSHQQLFNHHFSTILVSFQIAYGIGLLTAGRLIDKLGTRVGYALAIAIWALSSMGHALVTSVAGFCIARFLLGLGESGNFPAAIKATTEWFPTEERALATGLFNSGANAASLLAPWIIPIVTIGYGWHAAFLTTGSLGLLWLVLWLLFPYDRLRRGASLTQHNLDPVLVANRRTGFFELFAQLSRQPGLYAFSIAKALTDPIWWFYLFWLPKYFHETYSLDLKHLGLPIILIYFCSSFGSILGGALSGFQMKRGHTVDFGRKFAMLAAPSSPSPSCSSPPCTPSSAPTSGPPSPSFRSPPPPTRAGPPTSSPHPPTSFPPPPSPPSSALAEPPAPSAEPSSPSSPEPYGHRTPLSSSSSAPSPTSSPSASSNFSSPASAPPPTPSCHPDPERSRRVRIPASRPNHTSCQPSPPGRLPRPLAVLSRKDGGIGQSPTAPPSLYRIHIPKPPFTSC